MGCREFRGLLEEWLDGELSAEERAGVERHLQSCGECARYLQERRFLGMALKATLNERASGLRFLPPEPSRLQADGRTPLPRLRLRHAPGALLALAAAAVVVLLIFFQPWAHLRHGPAAEKEPRAVIVVSDSLDDADESFITGRVDGFTYLIHLQVSAVRIDDHS